MTSDRPSRQRTALTVVCLAIIILAAGVQVMHHCTAFELNQAPGNAPVYCAVCMTLQVAALVLVALVMAITPLPGIEVSERPQFTPRFEAYFALSVRPPPSL